MKTIAVVCIVGIILGTATAAIYSKPRPTDCLKVNNNVRGSIEYRCGCR